MLKKDCTARVTTRDGIQALSLSSSTQLPFSGKQISSPKGKATDEGQSADCRAVPSL